MTRKRVYSESEAIEYLGNSMEESAAGHEEENMASKYREKYTLLLEDGSKETIRIYGKNKTETDLKFQELCRERSNKSKWKSEYTFMEFVEHDYKPNHMTQPFIAETTQTKYEYNLKRYIYPELGDLKLDSITVNDIQKFRKKMAQASSFGYKKNLTSKSIEDMTGFLNKIFKVAEAMHLIEENPVKRPLLKKVGETAGHHKALSKDILDRCKKSIPKIKDERVRIYSALLFFNGGGMRPEEILGLKWSDIDLQGGYADVVRAVTYAGSNRHAVVKSTKTPNSVRGVILPKVLIDILGKCENKVGYVIHGLDSTKPIPYSGWQRTYRKMQEILEIKGQYCNYDLRTTYATEMIEEGYSSTITAKMMGHKDSRMVETVYAQTRRDGIESMRNAIEAKNASYSS